MSPTSSQPKVYLLSSFTCFPVSSSPHFPPPDPSWTGRPPEISSLEMPSFGKYKDTVNIAHPGLLLLACIIFMLGSVSRQFCTWLVSSLVFTLVCTHLTVWVPLNEVLIRCLLKQIFDMAQLYTIHMLQLKQPKTEAKFFSGELVKRELRWKSRIPMHWPD